MPTEGSIEKVVEDAVRAQVQQMIVTSLESVDGLTARIVAGALQAKVKDAATYREIPFIEKLCADAVREAAQQAAREWIEENRPSLVTEVKRQLSSQKADVAQSLVESLAKAAGSAYSFRLSISPADDR
jgi:hypothetical protein